MKIQTAYPDTSDDHRFRLLSIREGCCSKFIQVYTDAGAPASPFTGTIGSFGGEINIEPTSYTVITNGTVPDPIEYTISEFVDNDGSGTLNAADYEILGWLAAIEGTVVFRPGVDADPATVWDQGTFGLANASGDTATVFIDSTTGIETGGIDPGDEYRVVAPISIFSATLQMKPREEADLIVADPCNVFPVTLGPSWDGISLQQILDTEYGPGTLDVTTDYEGAQCGDAQTPYWLDDAVDGWIIREVADFAPSNVLGWYAETLGGPPLIDGVDDGVIFDGSGSEGETAFVGLPGPTRFGLYLNPNGRDDGTNAPEPEIFFTNRTYNDIGPDGSGAIHAPDGGDPQALIFNITDLRDGVPTYVVAWEDIDSGSELRDTYAPGYTDNDFNDLVVEIQASSPVDIHDDDTSDEPRIATGVSLRVGPNPFRPSTRVSFSVPARQHGRVAVYDVRGRQVDVLFDGIGTGAERALSWAPTDVASGIYFVRLETDSRVVTEKVTLLE